MTLPFGRAQFAGSCRQVRHQERTEVPLANEADAGGILFRRDRQSGLLGHAADLGLVQAAQRKQGRAELVLVKRIQEVGLVLAGVACAQQFPATLLEGVARIVAGRDAFGAVGTRGGKEGAELDFAIAKHIRVGRAAGAVLVEEVREHPFTVLGREIGAAERDAQSGAHRECVPAVVVGMASRFRVFVLPVQHEEPGYIMTCTLHQQRRHRRIDAARHADRHAHRQVPRAGNSERRVESGRRCPASQSSRVVSTSGLRRRGRAAMISG